MDLPKEAFRREGKASRGERRAYDYPYRQFLPRGVEGLLVTGRAAIVQPPCMRVRWMVFLMGQAAGVTPRALEVREPQKLLHNVHQVPLGDEQRLRELAVV